MRTRIRLGAVLGLLIALAASAAAQEPHFSNAKMQPRSAAAGLEREFRAIVSPSSWARSRNRPGGSTTSLTMPSSWARAADIRDVADRLLRILLDLPPGIKQVENWPVTFGIPFAPGALWDATEVRLVERPQFTVALGAATLAQKEMIQH